MAEFAAFRKFRSSVKFGALLLLLSLPVLAGTRPQVDLSLSIQASPKTFSPGGRSTVQLTLHNKGPSTAGTVPGSLVVIQNQFIITTQPPAFEVATPISGCGIERYVSEPAPDESIALIFIYYFDAIPAGQSRNCVFDVIFDATTVTSVPTGFFAYSAQDDETNPGDDRVDFVFVATPIAQAATPVPATSSLGVLALISGLLLAVGWQRTRTT